MKRLVLKKVALVIGIAGILSGCASHSAKSGHALGGQDSLSRALAVEISYSRGHNSHTFVLTDNADHPIVESFRDHQRLREVHIDPEKYLELTKAAGDTIAAFERHPAQAMNSPCRTPFSIKITRHEQVKTLEGCRSYAEAAPLGKLIREMEFLMYSDQPASKN